VYTTTTVNNELSPLLVIDTSRFRHVNRLTCCESNHKEFEDTKGCNQNPYIGEEQTKQWPN